MQLWKTFDLGGRKVKEIWLNLNEKSFSKSVLKSYNNFLSNNVGFFI